MQENEREKKKQVKHWNWIGINELTNEISLKQQINFKNFFSVPKIAPKLTNNNLHKSYYQLSNSKTI